MLRAALIVLVAVLLFLHGTSSAVADIEYVTEISGVEDRTLLRDLRDASQLVALQERPPASEAALNRRAASDLERLDAVLRAAGYYEATLSFDVDFKSRPALVSVNIVPGPPYTLARVEFVGPDGSRPPLIERFAPLAFGLEIGGPARSAPVLAAERRIERTYRERGYPLAKVSDRTVVVDRATHEMTVTYTIDAGPLATFGPSRLMGLSAVEPDYVRNRIAWQEDEIFDIRLMDRTRRNLLTSGLFSTVRIAPAEMIGTDGRIPITIDLTERAPRSIGIGLNYDTTLGASAQAFWEHRNVFGHAERFRVTGEIGQRRQRLTNAFRRPDFLGANTDLLADLDLEMHTVEAFDDERVRAFSGIERRLGDEIALGGGLQVERAHVEEKARTLDYTLIGTPLFMRRDATNDLLDPTDGSRQSLTVTPYPGFLGSDFGFVSSRLTGSAYRALDDQDRFVLAGFAAIGSIVGESRDALPKDKRLYAGGGGSIRGYGFQRAGPLDVDGDPIGGRSSLELGVELRIKITDTIGIAPFLEGGNVYESSLPDLGERLLYGAGLGFRYYTPIGPVRLDIGVPLRKRQDDDNFQVYISLGQAF